ncbi:type 1 glutamine amidotransferase-like domain-containing protein [Candidatus Beckwithbacteria bacterium]|nr:type 1 glutamine amidotransferase-like domain-containing protein [Candidatus Beckwithbacteria bacterium]
MNKFLLTSAGFINPTISKFFLKTISKPVKDIAVLFIPTASRTKEELQYVEESKQELLDLEIKTIQVYDLDYELKPEQIKIYDVVYVCGGSTFYLLNKMREVNFKKSLQNYQGLYVGVSAGSIVMGPDIEVSAPWDENVVSMQDTTGLEFVDFVIVPHYQRKDKTIVDKLVQNAKYKIKTITDNQAIFIEGNKAKLIE